jgi:hypothetical protein
MTLHAPWNHGRTLDVLGALLLMTACGRGVLSLVGEHSSRLAFGDARSKVGELHGRTDRKSTVR